MAERGIEVDHSTINRWVLKSAPELDKRIRPHLRITNDSRRVDETCVKAECRRGNLPPPNLLAIYLPAWTYSISQLGYFNSLCCRLYLQSAIYPVFVSIPRLLASLATLTNQCRHTITFYI